MIWIFAKYYFTHNMSLFKFFKSLTKFEIALWIGSAAVVTIAFLLTEDKDYKTLIASLIGVTSLIFIAKGAVIGQILVVAFSVLYGVISYHSRYYGEMITYLCMTTPMAVIAMISWLKHPYKALNLDGGATNPEEDELATINPFRYRGYYYDEESKLYYLITRYYDPWIGQFISPDSFENLDPATIGGINLYAYCNYNPIMYIDPNGCSLLAIFLFLVLTTLVGAVIGGIKAGKDGKEGWALVKDVILGGAIGLAIGGAIVTLIGVVGVQFLAQAQLY